MEAKQKIKALHVLLKNKKMTEDGRRRKDRIVVRIFYRRTQMKVTLNFYMVTLPLLKKYVCLFKTKQPMVHQLHQEQVQLFVDFLACFMKAEEPTDKTIKASLTLDVHSSTMQLRSMELFIGAGTEAVVSGVRRKYHDSLVVEFLAKVSKAYADCAHYTKKLPLNNPLLRSIAGIDPVKHGHNSTAKKLKRLPTLVTNVLMEEEKETYALDIHSCQVDVSLPSPYRNSEDKKSEGQVVHIDEWWATVQASGKYPALCKVVLALLSCYHGAQVETSFSLMGDILDDKSAKMKIETYSAIQTVKYSLKAQGTTANTVFGRTDVLHDPVNATLCRNMHSASRQCKAEQEMAREKAEKKAAELKLKTSSTALKAARAMLLAQKAEKEARLAHARRQAAKTGDKIGETKEECSNAEWRGLC